MGQLTLNDTVGQFVVDQPSRARVFEGLGIDYCCGGRKPLGGVCEKLGLNGQEVLSKLHETLADDAEGRDWSTAPLSELIVDIEDRYHAHLRRELPRLWRLVEKVARAHGTKYPELLELRDAFGAFRVEMDMHMLKEEQVLFPMIRGVEQGEINSSPAVCGSMQNPVSAMEHEHDDAGRALERFRKLTDGYTPREDACNSWRVMLYGLRELETVTHKHVHTENNILFPRAIELEKMARVGTPDHEPQPGDIRIN